MKKSYRFLPVLLFPLFLFNSCGMVGKLSYTDGETVYLDNPRRLDNEPPCPDVYEPVCGEDGKTYKNACFASIENVEWRPGKCEAAFGPTKKKPCPWSCSPVCGSDGKTYSHPCLAERAGVFIYKPGRCGDKHPVIVHPMPNPVPSNPTVVRPRPKPAPRRPAGGNPNVAKPVYEKRGNVGATTNPRR